MLRASAVLVLALTLQSGVASAQNSEDVIAGSDVALTGGAVVANVHTGGAMWFNPAGVARLDSRSVDLTGAVLSYSIVSAPGTLTLQTGEESPGEFSAIQAIPRALTFVASPRPSLRWGIGFFFSRVLDRFVQDTVSSTDGTSPSAEFFATADQTKSIYHLSSALAWKRSEVLLVGGGFDIVIASQRSNQLVAGSYDDGLGGAANRARAQNVTGGGLQMKAGLQWAPIKEVRFGLMVATPSYLVYLNEERTITETLSPPTGPPMFAGSQLDELNGAWAGVEAGLTRVGIAWLESWGWLEADLVVRFPLETPELEIDWKTTPGVQIGGIFKLTDRLKLGAGFFTDFSAERSLTEFGDTKIDYYGMTIGIDFANREKPPERGEDGFYLAFAVAVRYAYGSGDLVGLLFPASFQVPITEQNIVPAQINEIGVNLAVKAAF